MWSRPLVVLKAFSPQLCSTNYSRLFWISASVCTSESWHAEYGKKKKYKISCKRQNSIVLTRTEAGSNQSLLGMSHAFFFYETSEAFSVFIQPWQWMACVGQPMKKSVIILSMYTYQFTKPTRMEGVDGLGGTRAKKLDWGCRRHPCLHQLRHHVQVSSFLVKLR